MPLSPQSESAPGISNGETDPSALPFEHQVVVSNISTNGHTIQPTLVVQNVNGFFKSNEQWTCYRRNYISIKCSFTPNWPPGDSQLCLLPAGQTPQLPIRALGVGLSAVTNDGKKIDLVQNTARRRPGEQTPVPITKLLSIPQGSRPLPSQKEYHEVSRDGSATPGCSLPSGALQHTFERIQFKSATAHNSHANLQQFYKIHVELWAYVANLNGSGPDWKEVAHWFSAPVIVRGSSPKRFSNKSRYNVPPALGNLGGSNGVGFGGVPKFDELSSVGSSYGANCESTTWDQILSETLPLDYDGSNEFNDDIEPGNYAKGTEWLL